VDEGGLEWRGRGRGGGAGTREIWILQSGDHTRNSEECLDFILCTNLSCQRQIEKKTMPELFYVLKLAKSRSQQVLITSAFSSLISLKYLYICMIHTVYGFQLNSMGFIVSHFHEDYRSYNK